MVCRKQRTVVLLIMKPGSKQITEIDHDSQTIPARVKVLSSEP